MKIRMGNMTECQETIRGLQDKLLRMKYELKLLKGKRTSWWRTPPVQDNDIDRILKIIDE